MADENIKISMFPDVAFDYPQAGISTYDLMKVRWPSYLLLTSKVRYGIRTVNENYKISLNELYNSVTWYIGLRNIRPHNTDVIDMWRGPWYATQPAPLDSEEHERLYTEDGDYEILGTLVDKKESYTYVWGDDEVEDENYVRDKFNTKCVYFLTEAPIPFEEFPADPAEYTSKYVTKKYIDDRFNGCRRIFVEWDKPVHETVQRKHGSHYHDVEVYHYHTDISIRPYTCYYELPHIRHLDKERQLADFVSVDVNIQDDLFSLDENVKKNRVRFYLVFHDILGIPPSRLRLKVNGVDADFTTKGLNEEIYSLAETLVQDARGYFRLDLEGEYTPDGKFMLRLVNDRRSIYVPIDEKHRSVFRTNYTITGMVGSEEDPSSYDYVGVRVKFREDSGYMKFKYGRLGLYYINRDERERDVRVLNVDRNSKINHYRFYDPNVICEDQTSQDPQQHGLLTSIYLQYNTYSWQTGIKLTGNVLTFDDNEYPEDRNPETTRLEFMRVQGADWPDYRIDPRYDEENSMISLVRQRRETKFLLDAEEREENPLPTLRFEQYPWVDQEVQAVRQIIDLRGDVNRVHFDDRMTIRLDLFKYRQTQLNVKLNESKKVVIDTTGVLKDNLSKEIYDRLKRRNYDFTVLAQTFGEESYSGEGIELEFVRKDNEGQEAELLWDTSILTFSDNLSPYHYYCFGFKCFYMTDDRDDRTMIIIGKVLWKSCYDPTYDGIGVIPHADWMDAPYGLP